MAQFPGLGNVLNSTLTKIGQVAGEVESSINDTLQTVAQNIEQAFQAGPSERSGPPRSASSTSSSTFGSRASTQPTTPEEGSVRERSSQHFARRASDPMGNGGLCGERSTVYPEVNQENMICDNCSLKFSLLKRRKECTECRVNFCGGCLPRDPSKGSRICQRCKILLARPPVRSDLMELRVKDLQRYLITKKVSTKNCVEKKDLVELVIRTNGGQPLHSSPGAQSTRASEPTPPPRREPTIERQKSFPKAYVHSTHRDEWFSRFENPSEEERGSIQEGDETAEEATLVEEIEPAVEAVPEEVTPVEAIEPGENEASDENECDENRADPDGATGGREPVEEATAATQNFKADVAAEVSGTTSSPASPRRFANQGLVYLTDIKSLDDLQELSVKQAKEILAMNRVNFKGVVEKKELLKIIERLWNQEQKLQGEKDTMNDSDLCKICMDNPVDCVMLECGHMCTCTLCGKQMAECPICRQYVVRVVKIFKS